jgi:hypothetical protein
MRRMRHKLAVAALVALAAGAFPACTLWRVARLPRLADCPGALAPTSAIADGLTLRQLVRITTADLEVGVQLVAQKRGETLTLVGLTTLGLKAFTLTQTGRATQVDAALGRAWPVPPLNLLRDLHRTRFLAVPGGPFTNGEVRTTYEGTAITEVWRDGALVTRTFTRPGAKPTGAVRIEFAADTVRIANEWCGYEATIVTLAAPPS